MKIRLIKWIAFSLIFGLLLLGIKAGILDLCGKSIDYSDFYAEIVFFDLVLNFGIISETISLKKHKGMQMFLIGFGLMATVVLVALYILLIMTSYEFAIKLNFTKMKLPTVILSVASIIGSFSTQILQEVDT